MRLDEYGEDLVGQVLRAKMSAANIMLTFQSKTDENQFRHQAFDRLPELLRIIQEEERKMPARLIEGVCSTA